MEFKMKWNLLVVHTCNMTRYSFNEYNDMRREANKNKSNRVH